MTNANPNSLDAPLENLKILSEISQREYVDSINKSTRIDEKVGRITTIIGVLIVAFTTLMLNNEFLNLILKLNKPLIIVCYMLIAIIFACMFDVFLRLLYASKFTEISKISFDFLDNSYNPEPDKFLDAAFNKNCETFNYKIYLSHAVLVNENEEKVKKKIEMLAIAFKSMICGTWAFSILLVICFGGFLMTQGSRNSTPPNQNVNQQQPINRTVDVTVKPVGPRPSNESHVEPIKKNTRLNG